MNSRSITHKRENDNDSWNWTKEEDERLLRLKEDGVKVKDLAKHFPGRTYGAIVAHLYRSPGRWGKRWSKEEDDRLLQLRKEGVPTKDLWKHLPGRSQAAIETRVRGDKIRPQLVARGLFKKFEAELPEDELKDIKKLRADGLKWREVLRQYPHRSYDEISRKMNPAIRSNTASPHRPGMRWTEAEDAQLLRHRSTDGMIWREIQKRMPHRSTPSLRNRYSDLVTRSERQAITAPKILTKSDLAHILSLRDNGTTWAEITNTIGKASRGTLVLHYLKEKYLGSGEQRKGVWSEAEDRWLASIAVLGTKGWTKKAMMELRRSPTSIHTRVKRLRTIEAQKAAIQPSTSVEAKGLPHL